MKKTPIRIFLLLMLAFMPLPLNSQGGTTFSDSEMDVRINEALDYFSNGDYDKAIALLKSILTLDPGNSRAADILLSIEALKQIESGTTAAGTAGGNSQTERPDFSSGNADQDNSGTDSNTSVEKPDFSIRADDSGLVLPEETRSRFELTLSPNLVFPWNIGEGADVFPAEGSYSGSFAADGELFFNPWNRIIGIAASYSLFLLHPQWDGPSPVTLHVVDAMVSFRTFFLEDIDTKVIFKLSAGYRGYFSPVYDFYEVERNYLNGFNMGINLEGPFIYLFVNREALKNLILDLDMNLLFFPEINTLNLFDFQFSLQYRFNHFALGIHTGAYSVITPDQSKYIWMSGLDFNLRF